VTELADAEARCFAAFDRLLAAAPVLSAGDVDLQATLFEQIAEVIATGTFRRGLRRDVNATTAQRVAALVERSAGKIDPQVFRDRGVFPGVTDGTGNVDLQVLESGELISFLEEVRDVFRLLLARGSAYTIDTPSAYPVLEALLQTGVPFSTKNNIATAAAVAVGDYRVLLGALRERARYFEIHEELGRELASDDPRFELATLGVLQTLLPLLEARLPGIDPARRAGEFYDLAFLVAELAENTSDAAARGFFESVLSPLGAQNERLRAVIEGSGFCDPVRAELLLRGYSLVDLPHRAAGAESNHSVPVTGFYESSSGGTPATLQISQGGRSISGWMQFHGGGSQTARQRIRGALAVQETGVLTFAYLRFEDGGDEDIVGDGQLVAALEGGVVTLTTFESSPLIAGGVVEGAYVQTSRSAAYAEATVKAIAKATVDEIDSNSAGIFRGEMGAVFAARQRAPLHSAQMRAIIDQVNASAAQKGLFAEIDRHFDNEVAVANIDAAVGEILGTVSSEQVPLARLLVRQLLSSRFGGPGAGSGSYWERLMTARASVMPPQSTNIDALLGIDRTQNPGSELFTYRFTIDNTESDLPIEIKNPLLQAGAHLVEITVEKFSNGGIYAGAEETPLATYRYIGNLGQIGAGVDIESLFKKKALLKKGANPGGPPTGTASRDEFQCRSNFDYSATDLEGGFYIVSANAGASFVFGKEIESTAIIFSGAGGNKPPLVADPGPSSDLVGWRLPSAGIDFSFGAILLKSKIDLAAEAGNTSALLISADLITFETEGQVEFEGSVDFRSGSAELLDCGWQNLRELVAEHRALFDSSSARISVIGSTDTVPIATQQFPDNQELSEARAAAAKTALVEILGWSPGGDNVGRIVDIGVGETPARVAELEDNVDDPEWRQVLININGVASLRIAAPRTN